MIKKIISFSLGIAALAVLGAGSVEDEADHSSLDYSSPSYQVNYKALADEFDDNSIAAEAKYEGKLIYVTGPVYSIDKDMMDKPYIVISGKSDFDMVHCYLTDGEVSGASSLRKGERIVVAGVVDSTILGVHLDSCKVISS